MFVISLIIKMIWPLLRATVSHCLARSRGSWVPFPVFVPVFSLRLVVLTRGYMQQVPAWRW